MPVQGYYVEQLKSECWIAELPLISQSIVYGRVVLEKAAACDPKRKFAFEEMSIIAQRDERADGKPAPPALTANWTKQSGPGTVSFVSEEKRGTTFVLHLPKEPVQAPFSPVSDTALVADL